MNKLCIILYGAADKNSVEFCDTEDYRVIKCLHKKTVPNFFARRKIGRLSTGFDVFDSMETACSKSLFRRDIAICIKTYAKMYGIDCSDCEISVFGDIGDENFRVLSDLFRMVWVFGQYTGMCFNIYNVKSHGLIKTDFAIYADDAFEIPDAGIVFNLTDRKCNAVNNIEISANIPEITDNDILHEIVYRNKLEYRIISFIK